MGSERGRSDNDDYDFVAYDPANRMCTPADRSRIKRRAGKLGNETKKRRLRQNAVGRTSLFSLNERAESGAGSTSDNGGKRLSQPIIAQEWPSMLATRCETATPPIPFPDPPDAGFWTQIEALDWQNRSVHHSAPMSDNNSYQTTATSVSGSNRLTTTDSVSSDGDMSDPLSLRSEFTDPSFVGYEHQDNSQHPQHYLPSPFGSFDSGFYDYEPPDLSLAGLDAHSSIAPDVPALQQHAQEAPSKPNKSPSLIKSPPSDTGAYTAQHISTMHVHGCTDTLGEHTSPRNGNEFKRVNWLTPSNVATLPPTPSMWASLGNQHAIKEQLSPRTPGQYACSNVNNILVSSIQGREEKGQLSAGSSAECLRALSECDEARSLWILNLSHMNPELVQCPEQPADVYAKARTKLRNMPHRQQMDAQGILIKLGMAEYHAISFALKVTGLQQDIDNRKCLGILSKAEALLDHSLTGLAPGAQSVLNHLWPDKEGVRSLCKVSRELTASCLTTRHSEA